MLHEMIKHHYNEMLEFLNCLKVGVYITDGKGKTLLVNDESCKTGGLTRQEVMGRYMDELEREGFVDESVTLRALRSGQEEVMIQKLGDGGQVFASAHPVYSGNKIAYVIVTEKDITESLILRRLISEQQVEVKEYEEALAFLRKMNLQEKGSVVAVDDNMLKCVAQAERVAALDTTVLITGESGTGKEIIANLIYTKSRRNEKPFIKVNCSAIPDNLIESEMFGYEGGAFTGAQAGGKSGYFKLANGGTLFLDEIGEMPLQLQTKLLRVLQDKEVMPVGGTKPVHVDVRLIAATNKDLNTALEAGQLRKDLYYRLAVMLIEIPPLRERRADIALLATSFVEQFNKKYAFSKILEPGALAVLEQYDWPGNVRELQNVIERCIISYDSDSITPFQVSQFVRTRDIQNQLLIDPVEIIEKEEKSLCEMMSDYEKQVILSELKRCKNASEASRKLGIDRSTMSRHMKKHGIKDY